MILPSRMRRVIVPLDSDVSPPSNFVQHVMSGLTSQRHLGITSLLGYRAVNNWQCKLQKLFKMITLNSNVQLLASICDCQNNGGSALLCNCESSLFFAP